MTAQTARTRRDCACPRVKHQHGTRRAWEADHCRCLPCRAAHANATRAYRNGGSWLEAYTPSIGTVRRLRALAAAGVTSTQIVAHTGLSRDMVGYLRRGRHQQVTHTLAALIADAYDALWDKATGDGDSRRCATIARTAGWALPLAWDDDEIDDPAAVPHMPTSGPWDYLPCGTEAAARRHQRRGEPLDAACRGAAAHARSIRRRRAA